MRSADPLADLKYTMRKRAVVPAAAVLWAWQWFFERDPDAWRSVLATLCVCEVARFGSAALLRSATLEKREGMGTHMTSLVIAIYLNFLTLGSDQRWDTSFPFLHSPETSVRNVALFCHEGHVLLTYLFLDTCHMLRNWSKVRPNWPMIGHHALFAVVVSIGVLIGQAPRYQHISYLMLSAEFSTPFLNGRWILHNGLGLRLPAVNAALSLLFAVVFTLTRVVGYAVLVADLYSASIWELDMAPVYRHLFAGCITVAWLLNLYWFSLIVAATRAGGGGRKTREKISAAEDTTSDPGAAAVAVAAASLKAAGGASNGGASRMDAAGSGGGGDRIDAAGSGSEGSGGTAAASNGAAAAVPASGADELRNRRRAAPLTGQ